MTALVKAAKKVFKVVGNAVKKVADVAVNVVKGALKDPVGTVAKVAAVATGNAWALPLIDGASVVAKGGSFGDALKTAAISYATGKAANFVGNSIGPAAAKATSSTVVGKIIGAGAGASTVAIITGQDPIKAFATGGITAGVPAVLGKIDGFADLQKNNPTTAAAISSAVTAQLTGKSPTDALINGVIEATGIVNKAMAQFDPDNKLTASEKSILSNALLASTTAAVQGKDVSAAMSASLTQAGIKALGDMVSSGFSKSVNAVANSSDALSKNAAAIDANIKNQQSTAAEFNKINGALEGKIAEQNRLYDAYVSAKNVADADQESEDKYNRANSALDAYNRYTSNLNSEYESYYKPTLSNLEKKLDDLGQEYNTLYKESEAINGKLKTAIDATTEGAKGAQATTNKEIVMALDPKFDAAAYAKLNNVKAEDAYEDYLSKGQFAGAITNYDSYVSQKLKAVEEYDKDFNKEEYDEAIAAVMGAKDASSANAALNKIAANIDAGVTTRSEAIQLLKDAYSSAGMTGYEPSEVEIASLMEQAEAQSYTTAIRTADLRSVSFDGAGYANQSDAAMAARAAGYNNYNWNGKDYLLASTPDTRAIEDARIRLATEALAKQGKTILTATDSQLKAVMDQIDKVPTKHLSSATLKDVLSGKYTMTEPDGTLRLEVSGTAVVQGSKDAGRVTNMLPDGYQLATEDQVWGDGHTDKAEFMMLPDGTMAWVITGQRPLPSAIKSAGDVQDLIKTDPEAWLNLAAQYEKDVDINMSDFFIEMANSAMLGAYATGNKEFGDNVKQTLSIATQAVGEQAKSLANFFSSVTGTSYDNALAKAGKALQDWGAANQSESTAKQEDNITSAVENAKGVTNKIKAFVSASMDNPGGFATMIAKEGIQEILPMWAAKSVYHMGKVAYYGANAFMNGMESWGSNAGDTYAAALKQGMSESDARATASKVGLQSAIVTFVTDGVGDIPMLKAMAGDVIKGSLAGTAKAGVTNGITEYFDEMLSNASQQYALTGKVNWDQATTAGTIGMGVGAGTASGLTLGVSINQNAIVAKDVNGNNMTLAQFLAGDRVANMSTFNVNAPVGVAKDGDSVTIGSIISMPMADGINYETVKAGLPSVLTNQNIVIGKDALGDNVTLSQLMGQVTEKQDFDSLYTSLLNTTKEQRVEAQTDFLNTTLANLGYKPTKEEIASLISASPAGTNAIKQSATTYADTHTVTYDEAKKMLADAYTAQGFGKYTPTDAEIKKFMASGATVNPSAINTQVGTYVGGNTVTAAEAEKIFKETYGYQPSKDEIAQFTAVINQETQAGNIGAYVNPRQVTRAEAEQFFKDIGYKPTEQEIIQFIRQGPTIQQGAIKSELGAYVDPRMVDEAEARAAYEALGLKKPTQADVLKLVGQYGETDLAGKAKANLDPARYNSIMEQLDALSKQTGVDPSVLDTIKNDLNAQITALGGDVSKLSGQVGALDAKLSTAIADAKKAGLDGDKALQAAIDKVAKDQGTTKAELLKQMGTTEANLTTKFAAEISGVKADLAQTEKDILAEVAKNEQAGMTRDAALQKAIETVAALQKTDTATLTSKIAGVQTALGTEIKTLQSSLDKTKTDILAQVAKNEQAGMTRDAALQKAISDVAATQKTDTASLLTRLGTTEANLKSQFATQISGLDTKLTAAIADAKAAGLAGDAALKSAIDKVAASQNTTAAELLAKIGTTEAALKTQFASQISGVQSQISNVQSALTKAIADAQAAGLAGDAALQSAIAKVAGDLGTTKQDLLARLGATESALQQQISGVSADVQAKYNALSADQKALADALRQQGVDLNTAISTAASQISADVQAKYNSLSADQKALADALRQQGLDLSTAIETVRTQTQQQIGGLSADVQAKYNALTAEQKALAEQLRQQGVDTATAIEQARTAISADVQAKYDSLDAGQKALADQLAQQGVDLRTAIDVAAKQTQQQVVDLGESLNKRVDELVSQGKTQYEATQQAIAEVNQQNQQLQGLVGTQARTATQQDIDALTQMLSGQRQADLAYDVNRDNQITQDDINFLQSVVAGTKTDWRAPAGTVWGGTGLYGQIAANEAQRIADLQAAEAQRAKDVAAQQEANRQAAIRTTAGQAAGQVQQIIGQLPQVIQGLQTTTTPIYGEATGEFDLSSPLDVGFFSPSKEKQGSQTGRQATKIATGGYLDDLLDLLR